MAESQPHLLSDLPSSSHSTSKRIGPSATTESRNLTGVVIARIEDIFESFVECLLSKGAHLELHLKTRGRAGTQRRDPVTGIIECLPNLETRAVTFPTKSPQEAWRFMLLKILELVHDALVTGVVITKRDIYYRDPELFKKQAVVDRYVDDIAYTFGVDRNALNVVAAAKGLVVGAFSITRPDGIIIDYRTEMQGILVPSTKTVTGIDLHEIKWILAVEKEATFHTMAASQYWATSAVGKGVIITAKGYPDIQTRQFLRLLSIQQPPIPTFALVDFDPDGIGILSTYKNGSIALAHESASLCVPTMRWLGVRSSDILQDGHFGRGLLRLTARDRRIAANMLARQMLQHNAVDIEWRRELQVMLLLNVKAEIQKMGRWDKLGRWLDENLQKELASS